MSTCWVELDKDGPIRIFRNEKAALRFEGGAYQMNRQVATRAIRQRVFTRDSYQCVHCGKDLVWEPHLENSAELHEKQPRGTILKLENGEYRGGEVSLENSETRCRECHTGPGGAHGNRFPRFGEGTQ